MSISTKPYFVRALYEWCVDSGLTPYLVVHVDGQTKVPMQHVKDNQIVLNITPSAVQNLQIDNDWIHFNARFSGVSQDIWIPTGNVLSLFAQETGEGMGFELEESVFSEESSETLLSDDEESEEKAEESSPFLKIIK